MIETFRKILILQLLVLVCGASFGQARKLTSVKIEFEGFYTESFVAVSCDEFDHSFKDTKKIKVVSEVRELSRLKVQIQKLKKIKNRPIDVRGKIIYYYGAVAEKYCFNTFAEFYKGGKLFYSKELLIAISDIVYDNHPEYLDTLKHYD